MISEKNINHLIDSIYQAADKPSHWHIVLQDLCSLFSGGKAAILHRNMKTGEVLLDQGFFEHSFLVNMEHDFVQRYNEYFGELDVWAQVNLQLNSGTLSFDKNSKFKVYSRSLVRGRVELEAQVEDYIVLRLFEYGNCYTTLSLLVDPNSVTHEAMDTLNRVAIHIQRSARWGILKNPKFTHCIEEQVIGATLIDRYSLTSEEAKVAIAYSKSGDRESVSKELNKSVNTLKTHQKNIYRKMGLCQSYRKRNFLVERITEIKRHSMGVAGF